MIRQYIADAFTDKAFQGNQAAVCVMDSWISEELMMKIAMEEAIGVRPLEAYMGRDLLCDLVLEGI